MSPIPVPWLVGTVVTAFPACLGAADLPRQRAIAPLREDNLGFLRQQLKKGTCEREVETAGNSFESLPVQWFERTSPDRKYRLIQKPGLDKVRYRLVLAEPSLKESAILAAALQGRVKELQDLLGESKASASLLSDALVAASRGGHLDIAKELMARGAVVERSSVAYGMTPLAAASLSGHREVAEELLRRGAMPRTAQQMAALGRDRELARALEANPRLLEEVRCDESHQPLLHTAAAHGRVETARLLLRRGVPVNLSASDSLTPLHVAALHGRKEMVAYLLANKADLHARTRRPFLAGLHANSHTPLHLALAQNHPEVFAQLCDAGASLDDRNFPFGLMLDHALYRKRGRMVEVLVARRGKDHWPALLKA